MKATFERSPRLNSRKIRCVVCHAEGFRGGNWMNSHVVHEACPVCGKLTLRSGVHVAQKARHGDEDHRRYYDQQKSERIC